MKDMTKERITTAVSAACLAIMYVSAAFLLDVVEGKYDLLGVIIFGCFIALIYMFTLISEKRKTVLSKWLLSIPLAVPVWYWFVRNDFAVRALNWVHPGYGRQSGGGAFASVFIGMIFAGMCLAALVISLIFRCKIPLWLKRAQIIVAVLASVTLAVAVNVLMRSFPAIAEIMS